MKHTLRRFFSNLLVRILIAIATGIGCAFFFPEWLGRISATFNAIFSQFLGFLIPLLIIGFVTPAIGEVGKGAGKMLVLTVAVAYGFTVCAGLMAFGVADTFFPSMLAGGNSEAALRAAGTPYAEYFTVKMPPLADVTSALVFAFVFGLCIAMLPKAETLRRFFSEMRGVISVTINKAVIPLLPLYIFGIFLNMTHTGQVAPVLSAFMKIIAVIFTMSAALLLLQYAVAGLVSGRNPLKCLVKMLPAWLTALGTQSSAATIPVTLRQAVKMGVSEEVAGFAVPLCATIHLSGSELKITACAIALMVMEGIPYDAATMAGFVCMLAITMVAAPGVPGGAIMAALGVLGSILGFSHENQALMIALYIAMDSFGTAANVTGDGAVAMIVDRYFGNGRRLKRKNPDGA